MSTPINMSQSGDWASRVGQSVNRSLHPLKHPPLVADTSTHGAPHENALESARRPTDHAAPLVCGNLFDENVHLISPEVARTIVVARAQIKDTPYCTHRPKGDKASLAVELGVLL